MAHEYPRIEEHVGTRAASPTGELGARAESPRAQPADVALLELLADAYDPNAEPPDEAQLAALGRDLESGAVSARLREMAAALGRFTQEDVRVLWESVTDARDEQYRHVNFALAPENRERFEEFDARAKARELVARKLLRLLPQLRRADWPAGEE